MTIKTKRVLWILISMFVALIVAFMCVMVKAPTTLQQTERTVELTNSEIDYNNILNEFDDVEWTVEDSKTSFTGYQTLDASLFEELDNVSESDVEQNCGVQVKYDFSYDAETNIVTLSATFPSNDEVVIEEIYGAAYINEYGEIDAVFCLGDDEYITLSEMQDLGMIQNCGWFSWLVKAVVTVAAVAVCVATAGAGVAAVIAVGAAVSAASSVATQLVETGTVDLTTTLVDTAIGAVAGGAGAVVGKAVAKTAAQTATKTAAQTATKTAVKNVAKPSGTWKAVNESMSDASRAYQKQITGREGQAYVQNNVKFDGVIDGKLVDAKCHYSQFVDKNTGKFYKWFQDSDTGAKALKKEAQRQIEAANGVPIQWYFAEKDAMEAVKAFFGTDVTGIEFIFQAIK